MRNLCIRGVTWTVFAACGALSWPAHALEIGTGYINRLTNPDAYSTYEAFCCGLPMIQPGNKALIDDYWINAQEIESIAVSPGATPHLIALR